MMLNGVVKKYTWQLMSFLATDEVFAQTNDEGFTTNQPAIWTVSLTFAS
jgi:hypothetical protein